MKNFKISVVICAYNEEKTIERCINSLINQAFPNELYEIILIDDDSTDNMADVVIPIIKENNDLSIRYLKIFHAGLSGARNAGVSVSNGEIIAFMDGDAHADKYWLENIYKSFNQKDVSVVSGRVKNYNPNSKFFSELIYLNHFKPSVDTSKSKVTGTNMAYRNKVFNENLYFLKTFSARGDETYLVSKYFIENPSKKEYFNENSVVFNKHPENLIEWLRQQFIEGVSGEKINKILKNKKRNILNIFARIASVSFIPHFLYFFFFPADFYILLFHFSLFFLRNYYKKSYMLSGFNNVKKKFGTHFGCLGFFISILGTLISDIGNLVEKFFSKKTYAAKKVDIKFISQLSSNYNIH